MANILKKFNILLWKSYIIRKCHWIVTLFELCVPVLLFIGLACLNSFIERNPHFEPEHVYPIQSQEAIISKLVNEEVNVYLLYTPETPFTVKLMEMFKAEVGYTSVIKNVRGLESESDIENVFKSFVQNGTNAAVFGLVFKENLDKTLPKFLDYKIRSVGTPYLHTSSNLFVSLFDASTPEMYENNGFLCIQVILTDCFMKLIGKENTYSFSTQKFPSPAMKDTGPKFVIHELLPLSTVLSFIFLCPAVLKRIVEEKQTGVKELMKLMGLPSLLLWLGWFIHAMSVAVVSITVITIILGIPFGGVEPVLLCSGIIVWILLFLYCTASVAFMFAISALFKKPTIALVFGLLVWLGSGIATKFVIGSHMAFAYQILSSLLPNIALAWGYHSIFVYEKKDLRMSFGNVLNPSAAMGSDFQLWQVWIFFIMQTVVFFGITLYLEAIFPGDYGVAKPWYFPFMSCFKWMRVAPEHDTKGSSPLYNSETYEPLPPSVPIGINIRRLRKVFTSPWKQNSKVAVDGVSLDICKEQITALLGHNGAGKSTTMMILTGMLSPTSGVVEINGLDIKYHLNKIRESLGLCPQHNLLFNDLTVRQHLLFFAKLKGGPEQDPEEEVSMYATKLNLNSHLNKTPSKLSGGYKRRLCLALAFIGQSKTIILDEPTSGLDPEARREIWDLLLSMRGSRTILITTHIMEEADVLGDRIAIMDHGRVQCYGTPMFLKKLYGTGYILSILKKDSSDPERIEGAVKTIIPEAELKSCIASLMTFCLPNEQRNSFPELFALLQKDRLPLGIDSVGVSVTTLEEVFLRVGEIALEESGKNEDLASETSEKSECSKQALSPYSLKGIHLWLQQVEALLMKRLLVMDFVYLIKVLILVFVMILVTVVSIHPFGGSPIPPLQLDLSLYGRTNVMYTFEKDTPVNLVENFKHDVLRANSKIEALPVGSNITTELLQKGKEDKETYVFNYIVAAQLKAKDELVAMYSDRALHSLPISVNLLANALIKYETNDDEYGIAITNHPFTTEEPHYIDETLISLLWMSLVPFAMTFWLALFVILPMKERVSSSRQLQLMAGVSVYTYWFSLYLWDLLLHLLLCIILMVTVTIVDRRGVFSDTPEISTLFFVFFLYGVSSIPFSYFASFWKNTSAGCYAVLVMVNIFAGFIMVFIMEILHDYALKTADGLAFVFRLIPNFTFTKVLLQFVSQVMKEKKCLRLTESELNHWCRNPYGTAKITCCSCLNGECNAEGAAYLKENQTLLIYLGLSCILYMALVLIMDLGIIEWAWERVVSLYGTPESQETTGNDDVDGEAASVEEIFRNKSTSAPSNADLLVHNLKKKYGIIPKPFAVRGVSFQVKPGECFGLLGVNGAGKTTTFKMLTGAVVPTDGVAAIAGYRSDKDKSKYLSQIGYCPQHDALIECLSATKTLQLYGSLRGVPKDKLNQEVLRWINMMGLREYRNKPCGTYSGGNKRKLMAAMALIGGPPLVFLDEPTSGVDPVSRRNLWNSLIALQKSGQSIVLTSHSMEECEALCNRLGIMVDGQLMCMGNIPYLKNKYTTGSTIKLKLKAGGGDAAIENVKEKMKTAFPGIKLKDAHETLLHYQVTNLNTTWGKMFKTMEYLKETCDTLEDYTISETTLEEVFLSFAQT